MDESNKLANYKRKILHKLMKKKKRKIFSNNKFKILKIVIKLILLFIFQKIIQETNKNNFVHFLNGGLVSTKQYKYFEDMKLKYTNDSFLNPYLEQITILRHIYNKNSKKLKENKNIINIFVSLTNNYVYPTLVSINSVLINCNKEKTFIIYRILCTSDFSEDSISILNSLMIQYSSNLEMIFYNMSNNFIEIGKTNGRYTQTVYYRLLVPVMFEIDRVIYLDGDTLVFKDLTEMYQIELNDNYVIGTLDYIVSGIDHFGTKSKIYINAGVIILNLEKIRKDNKIYDLLNLTNGQYYLPSNDQTIINYVFYPKIGIMPSKYNIFNFNDELDIKIYYNIIRTKINITELKEAFKDPTTIHHVLCWPKMWSIHHKYVNGFSAAKKRNNYSCEKYYNLWHSFAKKTNYYNQILNFTSKD